MNNRIAPVQDSDLGHENQSPGAISSTSQSDSNSIIAGGVGIFSSGFAFGITALSLDVDKTFHEVKNQTSFAKNLGDEGKYGFALAISALTFLTSFLLARNYLKKIDRENNNQGGDGTQVYAQLGFYGRYPRSSFQNTNSSTNSISNSNNSR